MIRWLGPLLRAGAAVLIRRELLTMLLRRVAIEAAIAACILVLGVAALVFVYLVLFLRLEESLGPILAAAIMAGANLLLIGLVLLGRVVWRQRKPARSAAGSQGPASLARMALSRAAASKGDVLPELVGQAHALGRSLGGQLKSATPEFMIGAAVLGLIIGLDPDILGLSRRRDERSRR